MGDYNRPLSLNRWNYVEANPVNYTDPSGYITEDESDDAIDLVNRLSTTYNVRIPIDWGYRPIPHLVVPFDSSLGIPVGCYWDEGYWRSLRELELTEQTIIDVAATLGGSQKFIAAMGRVRITRVPGSGRLLHALGLTDNDYASPMSVPPPISAITGDLTIPNTFFDESDGWVKYIISHELGHRWDFETNLALSRGLMEALGTWICSNSGNNCEWFPYTRHVDPITLDVIWERPAGVQLSCAGQPPFDCPEPYALTYGLSGLWLEGFFQYYGILPGIEDWAESFANYVYPNYYPSISIGLSGLVPNGVRESYVRIQINSLP